MLINKFTRFEEEQLLNVLLNDKFIIAEDLPGSALKLYRQNSDAPFFLYKSGNIEISEIEKTLMSFYMVAFDKLMNVDHTLIPTFIQTIYFKYIFSDKTHSIFYPNAEKNNIILTHVILEDGSELYDQEELVKIANIFNVGTPPNFFMGELTKIQQDKILEMFQTEENISIKKFLITLLPELKDAILSISNLHSLILKSTKTNYRVKLFDRFDEFNDDEPDDYYTNIIIDFMNFIYDKDLSTYKLMGDNYYLRYISLIEQLFVEYMHERSHLYAHLQLKLPKYLETKDFELSTKYLQSNTVLLIQKDKINEQIFKIVLNAFKKKKKNTYGAFTRRIITKFNNVVETIKNKINKELINEDLQLTSIKKAIVKVNENNFNIFCQSMHKIALDYDEVYVVCDGPPELIKKINEKIKNIYQIKYIIHDNSYIKHEVIHIDL